MEQGIIILLALLVILVLVIYVQKESWVGAEVQSFPSSHGDSTYPHFMLETQVHKNGRYIV